MPWNLVFHSLFKVDLTNIGIMWYDYNVLDYDSKFIDRNMKTSIFNLKNNSWKEICLYCE